MKIKRFLALGLCIVALPFLCQCTGSSQAAYPPAQWTVILYWNGDNNLEGDFINAFLQAATVGSSANVRIIAQFDRSPKGYDTRYGGWTIANRFEITQGLTPTQENAVEDWGDGMGGREVDMANPMTLWAFMDWAIRNYPAEKYAVVVADHGIGWKGVCLDETSGDFWMFPFEVREAIQAAPARMNLVGFDACLMATLDMAWEMKDTGARVMVGSEASAHAWPYDLIFAGLAQNPHWTALELGPFINQCYYDRCVTEQHMADMTHSSMDLAQMRTLGEMAAEFVNIGYNFSDFDQVKQAATRLKNQAAKTVICSTASPDRTDAHGITAYFPMSTGGQVIELPNNYGFYTAKLAPFANDGNWRHFLNGITNPFSSNLDPNFLDARRQMALTYDQETFVDLIQYLENIEGI